MTVKRVKKVELLAPSRVYTTDHGQYVCRVYDLSHAGYGAGHHWLNNVTVKLGDEVKKNGAAAITAELFTDDGVSLVKSTKLGSSDTRNLLSRPFPTSLLSRQLFLTLQCSQEHDSPLLDLVVVVGFDLLQTTWRWEHKRDHTAVRYGDDTFQMPHDRS